jgi:hypothetical protein
MFGALLALVVTFGPSDTGGEPVAGPILIRFNEDGSFSETNGDVDHFMREAPVRAKRALATKNKRPEQGPKRSKRHLDGEYGELPIERIRPQHGNGNRLQTKRRKKRNAKKDPPSSKQQRRNQNARLIDLLDKLSKGAASDQLSLQSSKKRRKRSHYDREGKSKKRPKRAQEGEKKLVSKQGTNFGPGLSVCKKHHDLVKEILNEADE